MGFKIPRTGRLNLRGAVRTGQCVTRDRSLENDLVVAILRMHRALCIARASHVNGRNAYTHNILFGRSGPFRAIATSYRNRQAFLPNINGQFPHGTKLIPQRGSRGITWSWKAPSRSKEFAEVPDNEEDAARAAILDKVMKGRQPTELMLRCKF